MKGVVFTEFMEMVEESFGLETLDMLLTACPFHSAGAYTKVGTYDHAELVSMVAKLSENKKMPLEKVISSFGKYLFKSFTENYPVFFKDKDTFSFLKSLDGYIHIEVKKLYSDAELPRFEYQETENKLAMNYISSRPFADLAEGLIEETISYFEEDIQLHIPSKDSMNKRTFILEKK